MSDEDSVILDAQTVSCVFSRSHLSSLRVPFLEGEQQFRTSSGGGSGNRVLQVVLDGTPPIAHLLWFQHLLNDRLPDIALEDLWSVYVLYDFLYGVESGHPHMVALESRMEKNWKDLTLEHVLPTQFEQFRSCHHVTHGPGWPYGFWKTSRGKEQDWADYFWAHEMWTELELFDAFHEIRVALTFPPPSLPGCPDERMRTLVGPLWDLIRPALCQDLFWAGGSLVWAHFGKGDPPPDMDLDLFCRNPLLATELFNAVRERHPNSCYFVSHHSTVILLINDIPVSIQVVWTDPHEHPAETVYRFDLDYVRAYCDGVCVRTTWAAGKAWRSREVTSCRGSVRKYRLDKAREKGFTVRLPDSTKTESLPPREDVFHPVSALSYHQNSLVLRKFYPGDTVSAAPPPPRAIWPSWNDTPGYPISVEPFPDLRTAVEQILTPQPPLNRPLVLWIQKVACSRSLLGLRLQVKLSSARLQELEGVELRLATSWGQRWMTQTLPKYNDFSVDFRNCFCRHRKSGQRVEDEDDVPSDTPLLADLVLLVQKVEHKRLYWEAVFCAFEEGEPESAEPASFRVGALWRNIRPPKKRKVPSSLEYMSDSESSE